MEASPKIPFDQFIEQLLDADHPLAPKYFYSLSDLEPEEIHALSENLDSNPTLAPPGDDGRHRSAERR